MSLPTTAPDYLKGKLIDKFISPALLSDDTEDRVNVVIGFNESGVKFKYFTDNTYDEEDNIEALKAFKTYGVVFGVNVTPSNKIMVEYLNTSYVIDITGLNVGDDVIAYKGDSVGIYLPKGTTIGWDTEIETALEFVANMKFTYGSVTQYASTELSVNSGNIYYKVTSSAKVYDSSTGWVNVIYKTIKLSEDFVTTDDSTIEFIETYGTLS